MKDMLQLLAELHIRFYREMQDFPHKCAEVEDQELNKGPKAWEDAEAKLVHLKDCDLVDLAALWKKILLPLAPAQQGKTLNGLWHFHNKTHKHTTRIEEDDHSKNKYFIGGGCAKPRASVHQAASSMSEAIRQNFLDVGGRDLTLPPPSVRQLFANLRRATAYARPCYETAYARPSHSLVALGCFAGIQKAGRA